MGMSMGRSQQTRVQRYNRKHKSLLPSKSEPLVDFESLASTQGYIIKNPEGASVEVYYEVIYFGVRVGVRKSRSTFETGLVLLKRLSACFGGSFNGHEPAFWSVPLLAHFEWKESANSVNFSSNEVILGQNA